jgi:hypothetical protein
LSAIEFNIPGSGCEYLDLAHTELHTKLKIIKNDGTALGALDNCGPISYISITMFSNIEVYLNNKLTTSVSNTAAYRSYLQMLLSYNDAVKINQLSARMVTKDTYGQHDVMGPANVGYTKRKDYFKQSNVVDLVTFFHSELFNQDIYLINGVDVRLRFIRSKDLFCLLSEALEANIKLKIENIFLVVRRVEVNPSVALAHVEAMKIQNALYPITRVDTKVLTIASGLQSKSIDNIITGRMPIRCVVVFVDNDAFNGSYTKIL